MNTAMTPQETAAQTLALLDSEHVLHDQAIWFDIMQRDQTAPRTIVPGDTTRVVSMCAASAACVAAGYTLVYDPTESTLARWGAVKDGEPVRHIGYVARDLLGLDEGAADMLFTELDPGSARDELRRIAQQVSE